MQLKRGTSANDELLGGAAADILFDLAGDDRLTGRGVDTLRIGGDSGDVVHSIAQGWVQEADVSVQGTFYATYTHADIAAQLLVELAITRVTR